MKKSVVILLSIILTLLYSFVFAQKLPIKFGSLEESDKSMDFSKVDSSAAAVVLCNFKNITFRFKSYEPYFEQITMVHQRIKILKKEAYDLANVEVRLYNKDVEMHSVKAIVYNKVGNTWSETKMEKADIITSKDTKSSSIKKFTIPNVQEGSIIEYTYQVSEETHLIDDFYFQSAYPVLHSEFRMSIPTNLELAFTKEGYNDLEKSENSLTNDGSTNVTYYRWIMKNVPALRQEPYTPNPRDYMDKMVSSVARVRYYDGTAKDLASTWETVVEKLNEATLFGERFRNKKNAQEMADPIIQGKDTPKDKLIALYDYVTKNIALTEDGWVYLEQSFVDILKNKKGTRAEKNMLLAYLLQGAGIEATPVLVSEHDRGRVSSFSPNLSEFSTVIVQAKLSSTDVLLLDTAEPLRPPGILPSHLAYGFGLLVDNTLKPAGWVDLQKQKSVEYIDVKCQVKDNQLFADVSMSQKGLFAVADRRRLKEEKPDAFFKKEFKNLLGPNGQIKNAAFDNQDKIHESLNGHCQLSTENWADVNEERIYFSPMLTFGYEENPLRNSERKYPVDFIETFDEIYIITFSIPSGYIVEDAPKTAKIAIADGSAKFDYLVSQTPTEIKITSKLQIKVPVIAAESYTYLRALLDLVSAKHNEQIVLKKVE